MTATMTPPSLYPQIAARLRYYRDRAGLTQTELARATGDRVKREYISSIELGRIGVIYPDAFNALHRVLGFPAYEVLGLMGYDTDSSIAGVNDGLVLLARQMTDEQQRAFVEVMRSLLRAERLVAGNGHGGT